jgi:hypothetical protein
MIRQKKLVDLSAITDFVDKLSGPATTWQGRFVSVLFSATW